MKTECLAVFSPSARCSQIPSDEEIEAAKAKGYRCVRVTVEEIKS